MDPGIQAELELLLVEVADMQSKLDATFHEKLRRLIQWFPMFVLIPASVWKNVVLVPESTEQFTCEVFNADYLDGSPKMHFAKPHQPSTDNLLAWINECRRKHPDWFNPPINPWVKKREAYLAEIPHVYHILTLSPFWARDTTGNFGSSEVKILSSSYLPVLQEKQKKYREEKREAFRQETVVTSEEMRKDLLTLGLSEYLAFDLSQQSLCHILDHHLDLIINRHYV